MGQIIPLPVFVGYPNTSAALDPAKCVLLPATGRWVEAYAQHEDPLPRLCNGFQSAGCEDAAFAADSLMTIIARAVRRPMDVRYPDCPHLSNDEQHLLHAVGHAQAGYIYQARAALLRTLLPADRAEAALAPLKALAERLAAAGLFFRKRKPPAAAAAIAAIEA